MLTHLVIESSRSPVSFYAREMWNYRELFYFLTWRDIKVRYKQTALGAAWAIMQPLFNMILFTLIFGRLARMPSDNIPYPLFAFAGLLPWTFFSNAIGQSANSLVGSSQLLTKVYFPRMIVPAASVLAGMVDFLFAFLVMVCLMIFYGVPAGTSLLMLPVLLLMTSLLALGVGLWLSAVNVKFRDVRHVIPFFIQLWMFATPIIYPTGMLPERLRPYLSLNPMTGIIEGFRVSFLGGVNGATFNWQSLLLSAAIVVAVLTYASIRFRRMEKTFADVI